MSKIYFLGGLGLDNSIINDISLRDNKLVFIDWEKPAQKETLTSYSSKIISKYNIDIDSTLIGVSFGGFIALEISKVIPVRKVILVSSFLNINELPFIFRTAIRLRLYHLFPPFILKLLPFVLNYFFSISNPPNASILKQVIERTDSTLLNWAIKNILRFLPADQSIKIVRIHGDLDRIIPINKRIVDYVVPNGGHFMIYDKKKEVTSLLDTAVR